ncbi:hypothetical protein PVA38_11985 [Streptococcus pneumoniae D39]|nr:hypothetical protein PVA38_11985 [Streptococcus pneumoniae D39]
MSIKTRTPCLAQGVSRETEESVSYTHLRAHETVLDLVCRLLLEKNKKITQYTPLTICSTHFKPLQTLYHSIA